MIGPFDVASGSVIMAMGIFLLGSIHQFTYIEYFFKLLLSIVVMLWIVIIIRFICSLFNEEFLKKLWNQHIQSFGLGTLIAATSVITILVHQQLPKLFGYNFLYI